jgi:hypothetical protein
VETVDVNVIEFDWRKHRQQGGEMMVQADDPVDVLTQPTKGTTIQVRIPLEHDKAGDISGVSERERAFG